MCEAMDEQSNRKATNNIDAKITSLKTQKLLEKEDILEGLIVRILVKSTLKEYYEKSNKVP